MLRQTLAKKVWPQSQDLCSLQNVPIDDVKDTESTASSESYWAQGEVYLNMVHDFTDENDHPLCTHTCRDYTPSRKSNMEDLSLLSTYSTARRFISMGW